MTASPRATPDQGGAELSDEQIVSIYNASCNHLGSPDFMKFARAILAAATQPAPSAEPASEEVIELAQALEQKRGLRIVADVAARSASFHDGPFRAGYETACEEVTYRLRTEVWELCLPPIGAKDRAAANQGAPLVDPACGVHGPMPCEGAGCVCAPELVAAQGAPTPAQAQRTDLEWLGLPEIKAKFVDYALKPNDANALRIIRACMERAVDAGKTGESAASSAMGVEVALAMLHRALDSAGIGRGWARADVIGFFCNEWNAAAASPSPSNEREDKQ